MQTSFQASAEVDDQAPASRPISAYRRCKEMNPRWMLEERSVPQPGGTPRRAEVQASHSAPFKAFHLPPLH